MTVFRTPDGKLTQFDFGPGGGRDIHVSGSELLSEDRPWGVRPRKCVPGEIREHQLASLPATHMYLGRTKLSLQDIRSYNDLQQQHYELHRNDCRHYVNNLVRG
ncbi:hypothetical protein WJX72_009238 [[Myrmecia] bisecta]|uniref:MHC class I antigen n=1 Tax=[Myrmecia] bisecta TaxID=41462 RepID=A0AAW1Q7Y2_9CHLO